MTDKYFKDFESWNKLKVELDKCTKLPSFKEREVWWVNIGVNVGFEIDGKHEPFHRPVIVLKKFSRRTFIGVPLTTKIKDFPYYHHFQFKDQKQCAILNQIRLFDSKRLSDQLGKITPTQFRKIKHEVKEMF